jgi:hypothetical protein
MNRVMAMACFVAGFRGSGANQIATGSAMVSTQPMRWGQPAEDSSSGGSAATGQVAGACSPI